MLLTLPCFAIEPSFKANELVPAAEVAKEPKFHFGDYVKVIHGFYNGCQGKVYSYEDPDTYTVDVVECKGYDFEQRFEEKDLRLLKESK